MDGGVFRVGVLLDCITAVGFDSDLTLFLDLGNLAARLS